MPKVVGIRFKRTPKIYYFEAGDNNFTPDGGVIVETARGIEYGTVAIMPCEIPDDKVVSPLKPIIRVADEKDNIQHENMEAKREEAKKLAAEKIYASGLNMKLVDVKYTFDGQKLIIYFTSEGRVDFRELVKELASAFRVRIELRQIGTRDECKMVGGIGPCGRPCCCSAHNLDHAHVSIKMAKNQGLALNPGKINGLCGNLMCCLEYENDYYVEVNKIMPKLGGEVALSDGTVGIVTSLNQIKKTVTVKIAKDDTYTFKEVPLSEIAAKGKGEVNREKRDRSNEDNNEQAPVELNEEDRGEDNNDQGLSGKNEARREKRDREGNEQSSSGKGEARREKGDREGNEQSSSGKNEARREKRGREGNEQSSSGKSEARREKRDREGNEQSSSGKSEAKREKRGRVGGNSGGQFGKKKDE